MIYKNSFKILMNNFSLVWKQLLYLFFTLFIVVLLTSALALPVVDMLKEAGWTTLVSEFVETVYTSPKDLSASFTELAKTFLVLIKDNWNTLWISYILVVGVVIFVPLVMIERSKYICTEIVEANMSSLTKLGYLNVTVSKFWKSLGYAFLKLLGSIPFYALYVGIILVYLLVAKVWITQIILFPVLIMLLILVYAIKMTVFSCFAGELVYNKKRRFVKCLFRGIKKANKNFWKIVSNSICFVLTCFTVNVFVAVCTLGAGLVVTIPASFVWLVCFNLATYFIDEKKRFYISQNAIVDLN